MLRASAAHDRRAVDPKTTAAPSTDITEALLPAAGASAVPVLTDHPQHRTEDAAAADSIPQYSQQGYSAAEGGVDTTAGCKLPVINFHPGALYAEVLGLGHRTTVCDYLKQDDGDCYRPGNVSSLLFRDLNSYIKRLHFADAESLASGHAGITFLHAALKRLNAAAAAGVETPWQLYSVAVSSFKRQEGATPAAAKSGQKGCRKLPMLRTLHYESVNYGWDALAFLRTYARLEMFHRMWNSGARTPNVYQVAAVSESIMVTVWAASCFLMQSLLVVYCIRAIDIEFEDTDTYIKAHMHNFALKDLKELLNIAFTAWMLPLAFVVSFNIIPVILDAYTTSRNIHDCGFWRASRRGYAVTLTLRAMDVLINSIAPFAILTISFLLIATADDPMDAVLNSVALLFIPSLDDDIVTYITRDPYAQVIDALTDLAIQDHIVKLSSQRDATRPSNDLELPGYADCTIGKGDCHFQHPFEQVKIIGVTQYTNSFVGPIIDTADTRSSYLFAKIRYQTETRVVGTSGQLGDQLEFISWIEFTWYNEPHSQKDGVAHKASQDSASPMLSFTNGSPNRAGRAAKPIHVLQGDPLVVVGYNVGGSGVWYSLRVMKFGKYEDMQKFFAFFHQDDVPFH